MALRGSTQVRKEAKPSKRSILPKSEGKRELSATPYGRQQAKGKDFNGSADAGMQNRTVKVKGRSPINNALNSGMPVSTKRRANRAKY